MNNRRNYQLNESLRKTRRCKLGSNCPRESHDCWFAHEFELLRPRPKVCVAVGDTNLEGGGRIGGGGIGGGGIGGGKSSSRTKKKTGSAGNKDSTQAVQHKTPPDVGKMCLREPIKQSLPKPIKQSLPKTIKRSLPNSLPPPPVPATPPAGNEDSPIIKRSFSKQVVTPIVEKPLPLVPALPLPTLDFATPPLLPPTVGCVVVKPKPVFNIVAFKKFVSPLLGLVGEWNLPAFADEAEMMLMETKGAGGLIKRYEAIRSNVSYVSAMKQFALRYLDAKYGQLILPTFAQELEIMMYGETRNGGLIQRYEELLTVLDADSETFFPQMPPPPVVL